MNTGASSKRSPLKFFILVLALSIPFWLAGVLVKQGLPLPLKLPASSLMVVCPLVAAMILVFRENGYDAIKELLKRTLDYKRIDPKIWYVPIITLMPVVLLLSYGVMCLIPLPLPEPHIRVLSIPILFVVFFLAAVGEEGGWMGYAIDPMLDRWGALTAGALLGLVWVAWHIIPLVQSHRSPEWIGWWCLGTVAIRIVMVWLYVNTGKSVMAAVLFHAVSNVSYSLFPNDGSHYDPAVTGVILVIAALLVTFLWGPKTLARFRYAGAGE
jgi:membrane protease YdiL (CAAX protease family)